MLFAAFCKFAFVTKTHTNKNIYLGGKLLWIIIHLACISCIALCCLFRRWSRCWFLPLPFLSHSSLSSVHLACCVWKTHYVLQQVYTNLMEHTSRDLQRERCAMLYDQIPASVHVLKPMSEVYTTLSFGENLLTKKERAWAYFDRSQHCNLLPVIEKEIRWFFTWLSKPQWWSIRGTALKNRKY